MNAKEITVNELTELFNERPELRTLYRLYASLTTEQREKALPELFRVLNVKGGD